MATHHFAARNVRFTGDGKLEECQPPPMLSPQARSRPFGDAYATAQLLLVMLQKARREGVATAEAFTRLASSASWLPRRR